MGIFLKNLQNLTAQPTAILVPYIQSDKALFLQLLLMLPFEPRLAARLQQNPMSDLLWYL